MDRFEKIIVISFIIAGVITFLWRPLLPEYNVIGSLLVYLTYGILLALICYYLIKAKFSIYSLLLVLLAISLLGPIAKLQHLPGAGVIKILAIMPYPFLTVLLIWTGVKHLKSNTGDTIYNFILALIFLSFLLVAFADNWPVYLHKFLNYTLVATIMTMKLKNVILNKSEDKVLTVVLLIAILPVIMDAVRLI